MEILIEFDLYLSRNRSETWAAIRSGDDGAMMAPYLPKAPSPDGSVRVKIEGWEKYKSFRQYIFNPVTGCRGYNIENIRKLFNGVDLEAPIDHIRNEKCVLKAGIENLLDAFENKTGLTIRNVRACSKKTELGPLYDVKIEVSL